MSHSSVLVLGAGFGGIAAAVRLASQLPRGSVRLVDARESFTMGLVNLREIDGRGARATSTRPLAALARHGIDVVRAEIQAIDPGSRRVTTTAGTLDADRLIVALGATTQPSRIAGLPEHASDVYDLAGARGFHRDLRALRDGDRALVVAHSMPFKCPPAPYETAMLAARWLAAHGTRAEVVLATPEPHPLPVFPPDVGAFLRKMAEDRGVRVRNGIQVAGFGAGSVRFSDGSEERYRALGIVPPHAPPPAAAALAGASGWIEVDPATLRTRWPDVWAIGDCTLLKLPVGKPIPKAGVLAEAEGLVVAENVLRGARGEPEGARFEGRGTCWIELGDGLAMEGRGDFFAMPPSMTPGAPSADAMRAKERFEDERLAAWFG